MDNYDFEEGIRTLQTSRLSTDEKACMLENLLGVPHHSRYTRVPWFLMVTHPKLVRTLAVSTLVFLAGGSTMYAALDTVPGDPLYEVKVGVDEPIRGAFALTPNAQAKWQSTLAARRLREAEVLSTREGAKANAELLMRRAALIRQAIADLKRSAEASLMAQTTTLGSLSVSITRQSLERLVQAEGFLDQAILDASEGRIDDAASFLQDSFKAVMQAGASLTEKFRD